MTSLFDGMTGVLAGVFGAPVTWRPAGGAPAVVQSVFREVQVESQDPSGHAVLDMAPIWRVRRPLADQVRVGDMIEVADGRTFMVLNRHPGGSPAADAFVSFELEART